jgi:hypothetical protein
MIGISREERTAVSHPGMFNLVKLADDVKVEKYPIGRLLRSHFICQSSPQSTVTSAT